MEAVVVTYILSARKWCKAGVLRRVYLFPLGVMDRLQTGLGQTGDSPLGVSGENGAKKTNLGHSKIIIAN